MILFQSKAFTKSKTIEVIYNSIISYQLCLKEVQIISIITSVTFLKQLRVLESWKRIY